MSEGTDGRGKYLKLFRTIFVSGGAFALNYAIMLVLTRYISEAVGVAAYGFVTLSKDFAQYAMIVTTALNSYAARYIALEYHRGNREQANVYFSSTFFGDAALSLGIGAVFVTVILFLERLLQVPPELVGSVKLLFLAAVAGFVVTTVFTVYGASAFIRNKLDMAALYQMLSYLAEAAVLILCFRLFPANVFYVGLGTLTATVVVALGNRRICRRYTPDLRVRRRSFSLPAVKQLVADGVWMSVNSLGNTLNNGLDLIVCNLMLTPVLMGQLAVAKTIQSIFLGLFLLVRQAFQPMFLKSYVAGDTPALMRELKLSMKVSGMLANIAYACLAALGMVYFRLWVPGQNIRLIFTLTLINSLTAIPGGPMQPLYYIYILTLKKKFPTLVTVAGGLFNVAGMYVLIRYTDMGVYAVVWTTVAVMFAINYITNPLYMAHALRVSWWTFYPGIIRHTVACAVLVILFRLMTRVYLPDSWLTLILTGAVLALIGAAVHLAIVCDRQDWAALAGRLRRRG